MTFLREAEVQKEPIAPERKRYLAHTEKLMMVVIDFSDGPSAEPDPPHSHPHEQVSYVVAGELVVYIGDSQSQLGPGDMFCVPPNVPHTVQLLSDFVRLVDTFTPIREEFIGK